MNGREDLVIDIVEIVNPQAAPPWLPVVGVLLVLAGLVLGLCAGIGRVNARHHQLQAEHLLGAVRTRTYAMVQCEGKWVSAHWVAWHEHGVATRTRIMHRNTISQARSTDREIRFDHAGRTYTVTLLDEKNRARTIPPVRQRALLAHITRPA